ncbi:hypothetical protein [Streptomyces hesseae]|uniref:Lipoprotein n=1 Tax=Streptomyces hesseae TaxID=3075519 RepID=A0ABU2ST18_9ACTN|nr:hypothetical protein [Streptomyces sp. DSM 40473]MDT0451990.1 hypothetical protein [Streptomyces sp. DSM 40473]
MRRKTLVCLVAVGTLATAGCGGGDREGRVATGAAGPGTTGAAGHAVPPKGGVELIPLPAPSPRPSPTAGASPSRSPRRPAPALIMSEPRREPADERWCERVTLAFANTGGTAIASGTVTLTVHILGKTGIDRATIPSIQALPSPIAPGGRAEDTWKVCVDARRVLPGMRIETREVRATWT